MVFQEICQEKIGKKLLQYAICKISKSYRFFILHNNHTCDLLNIFERKNVSFWLGNQIIKKFSFSQGQREGLIL